MIIKFRCDTVHMLQKTKPYMENIKMLVMNKTGLFGSEIARTTQNRYGISKHKKSIGLHYRKASAYFYLGNMANSFGKSVQPVFNPKRK